MKITRLTTHWKVEQLIDFLDMLDEIRESLINTYREELHEYHQQRSEEKTKNQIENLDLFKDIDF